MNGAKILQARRAKSLSQQAVASAAGISQEYLSRLERGDRVNLNLDKLTRLLTVLGLNPNDLICLPEIPQAANPEAAA